MLAADRDVVQAARDRENVTFGERLASAEMKEAVGAFFAKRAPNFDGLDEG